MRTRIQDSIEVTARLLRRAQTEQLIARRDPDDPHVAWVSSSNIEHHWYRVTRTSCSCPAFSHQGDCKHRVLACHLADNGLLPFKHAGEFVSAGNPSLKTRIQSGAEESTKQYGWVDGTPESKLPSVHDMRERRYVPAPNSQEAIRLAWSYCS